MIDNGYTLNQMELVNWGNFHGYQKFNLRKKNDDGGLFSPPQASAILGVNGSGKTTLIDALMISLLPFENLVKLGVTNDYETGSGGGRSIRDYVLGKYSSNQEMQGELEDIFGRKSGCSILLLTFQHNRNLNKYLSLGRIWWYNNHKVSDKHLGFLSFEPLNIMKDFCNEQKLPKSPQNFKLHLKEKRPHVQVFETMNSYSDALSSALGGIRKEDLKLLNRAFYVKSISQIDTFIKDNMLVEAENPHLDRLLENVRNGKEIASAIEDCENKLSSIAKILRELERLQEFGEQIKELQRDQSLLQLLPDFNQLQELKNGLEKDEKRLSQAKLERPHLVQQLNNLEIELDAVRAKLNADGAASQIAALEKQIHHLSEKIVWAQSLVKKWQHRLKGFNLNLPKKTDEALKFKEDLEALLTQLRESGAQKQEDILKYQNRCFELESQCNKLREEIEHLTKNGTLIPKKIYDIKQMAIRDLKLPHDELRFFGELMQVRPQFQQHRKPVEAVFNGVARNLLCHPKHLGKLTKWLNKNGFKADIVVKRISDEQLHSKIENLDDLEPNSVLNFIEVLPESQHPFTNYIWRWCLDVFNYQLADAEAFKGKKDKLVTDQGLLKNDPKTMRKLKQDFSYLLGWDTKQTIEEKTKTLIILGKEYQTQMEQLKNLKKDELEIATQNQLVSELLDSPEDLESLCSFNDLDKQKVNLEKAFKKAQQSHPELKSLKDKQENLFNSADKTRIQIAKIDSDINEATKRIENMNKILPLREQSFYSSKSFKGLEESYGSNEKLIAVLQERNNTLSSQGLSLSEALGEIDEKRKKLEEKKITATARGSSLLAQHQRIFSDPNVSYQLNILQLDDLIQSWQDFQTQLERTELPQAKEKWTQFFNQILVESVKDTLNEIKIRLKEITNNIDNINEVLKLTNFEELPDETRYLQIVAKTSQDDRVMRFRRTMKSLESVLRPSIRMKAEEAQSQEVIKVLEPFVEEFQKEVHYRQFVTDVRNHFQFQVHSLRRMEGDVADVVVESFTGAKKDAKSSAQTTQLAYALLASSLAYRFRFHDPVNGADTPRLIVLDEFGGKFDNEKPREIVKLLDKMGFQSVLLSPMSKADLLAQSIGQMIFVHKLSSSKSKVTSFEINSLEDYEKILSLGLASTLQPKTKSSKVLDEVPS